MPVITALRRRGGASHRVAVEVDGVEFRTVPESFVQRHRLGPGLRLTSAALERLAREADRERALDDALRYLSYRPRSTSELRRYLRRRGHAEALVSEALERCEALGYLNDRAFAVAFVRERIRLSPRGRRVLVAELRRRGVAADVAEEAIRDAFEHEEVEETELLEAAAQKRWRAIARLDSATARRRLTAYLSRRGFAPGAVRDAVERLIRHGGAPPE